MRPHIAVIGLFTAMSIGCSDTTENGSLPEQLLALGVKNSVIVMEPGKEYDQEGFGLRVDSVLNESRCPEGAHCIWAGNVQVAFNLELNDHRHFFILNTNSQLRRDTVIQGARYTLIDVSPYPDVDKEIAYDDYRVTVSVGE